MIVDYPTVAGKLFPDFAADLITFRQRPDPEFPDLPRWTIIVSRADLELQRSRGKNQVPMRNKQGEKLSCVHDRLPVGLSDAFAKKHGWPFSVHISNLDNAEQLP